MGLYISKAHTPWSTSFRPPCLMAKVNNLVLAEKYYIHFHLLTFYEYFLGLLKFWWRKKETIIEHVNFWDRAQFSGVKMPSASFLVDYFFQLKFGLNDVPILCVPPDHQSQINIWRTGKRFIPFGRFSFHLVAKKKLLFHKNDSILS